MIWIQFAILIAAILAGSRMKGIGLGVMGMVGLLIFVFVFKMKPSDPPIDVMLIIFSVVATAATLQAAGGMDYLVGIAEKILRSKPSLITLLGPLVCYSFTLFAGTSHINYSLLPIIAEVATRKKIRPERPLSISVVAAHLAITASPVSAATAAMTLLAAKPAIRITDVLLVCIPATIIGTLVGVLAVWKMGKELYSDPEFLEKMKDPDFAKEIAAPEQKKERNIRPGAKISVMIFALGVMLIILVGSFPQVLPTFGEGSANLSIDARGNIKMAAMIEMIMLSAAAFMMIFSRTTPAEVSKASLFSSGSAAVIAVFGVVWMSATFMDHNHASIEATLGEMVKSYSWTFAIAMFILSMLLFSQAATVKVLMPLGVSLGISTPHLLAMFPAANGDFFLPGYPTLLAAINFDRTGTTKIGKYLLNHSFMRAGLVGVAASVAAGFLIASIVF